MEASQCDSEQSCITRGGSSLTKYMKSPIDEHIFEGTSFPLKIGTQANTGTRHGFVKPLSPINIDTHTSAEVEKEIEYTHSPVKIGIKRSPEAYLSCPVSQRVCYSLNLKINYYKNLKLKCSFWNFTIRVVK